MAQTIAGEYCGVDVKGFLSPSSTNPSVYDRTLMRAVRFVAASFTVIIGAYLLLLANGVSIAMQQRAEGWNITPLPPIRLLISWCMRPAGSRPNS
jgi:hypothetical protein